jgi:methyl-accepting chemotaxis protein
MGSVVKKIIVGFTIILCTISAITVLLLIRTYKFNNEYSSVLQNVLNLNQIKTNTANAAADISNACIMQKNIEESKIVIKTDQMLLYLDELDTSIGDDPAFQGNRSMVNSLRQPLTEYKTEIEKIIALGDGTKFPALNNEVNVAIGSIRTLVADLSSYSNSNVAMELERSAVVQKEIEKNFRKILYSTIIVFAIILIISTFICVLLIRSITKPIKILKKEIALIAKGDLTRDNMKLPNKDEFSILADAFNMMSNSLKDIIGKVVMVTSEITDASETTKKNSEINMENSQEINSSAEDINQRMHGEGEEIGMIMAQIQEMEKIALNIAEDTKKVDHSTRESKNRAEEGNQSIEAFIEQLTNENTTVSQISEAAKKFGTNTEEMDQILSGISDISQQTKVLSLNASIEAARAGDAGKGFAVVASEINNLAERTVQLVDGISKIVDELRVSMKVMSDKMEMGLHQLQKGNEMADETQKKFTYILNDATKTSVEIQGVHHMTDRLSKSVLLITDSMSEVSDTIEENTKITGHIVKIVENQAENQKMLSEKIQTIEDLSHSLKDAISKFKTKESEV